MKTKMREVFDQLTGKGISYELYLKEEESITTNLVFSSYFKHNRGDITKKLEQTGLVEDVESTIKRAIYYNNKGVKPSGVEEPNLIYFTPEEVYGIERVLKIEEEERKLDPSSEIEVFGRVRLTLEYLVFAMLWSLDLSAY